MQVKMRYSFLTFNFVLLLSVSVGASSQNEFQRALNVHEYIQEFFSTSLDSIDSMSIRNFVNLIRKIETVTPSKSVLFNELGIYLFGKGDFDGAEAFLKRSLQIVTKHYGKKDPCATVLLENLAAIYSQQGMFAAADSTYRQIFVNKMEGLDSRGMFMPANGATTANDIEKDCRERYLTNIEEVRDVFTYGELSLKNKLKIQDNPNASVNSRFSYSLSTITGCVAGSVLSGALIGGIACIFSRNKAETFIDWTMVSAGIIFPISIVDGFRSCKKYTYLKLGGRWVDPEVHGLKKDGDHWFYLERDRFCGAIRDNSCLGYARYLEEFPSGNYRDIMKRKLVQVCTSCIINIITGKNGYDTLNECKDALRNHPDIEKSVQYYVFQYVAGYEGDDLLKKYLEVFPTSPIKNDIRRYLEMAALRDAVESGSVDSFQCFFQSFPDHYLSVLYRKHILPLKEDSFLWNDMMRMGGGRFYAVMNCLSGNRRLSNELKQQGLTLKGYYFATALLFEAVKETQPKLVFHNLEGRFVYPTDEEIVKMLTRFELLLASGADPALLYISEYIQHPSEEISSDKKFKILKSGKSGNFVKSVNEGASLQQLIESLKLDRFRIPLEKYSGR